MINRVILQGRLVRDPELRQTGNGAAVCSFTVANSKKYKEREDKLFLDCTAWRGTAEFICRYFHKGDEIAVEGQLWTESFEDREGNKRSINKLTVTDVHFCGSKSSDGSNGVQGEYNPSSYAPVEIDEEADGNLPF